MAADGHLMHNAQMGVSGQDCGTDVMNETFHLFQIHFFKEIYIHLLT